MSFGARSFALPQSAEGRMALELVNSHSLKPVNASQARDLKPLLVADLALRTCACKPSGGPSEPIFI